MKLLPNLRHVQLTGLVSSDLYHSPARSVGLKQWLSDQHAMVNCAVHTSISLTFCSDRLKLAITATWLIWSSSWPFGVDHLYLGVSLCGNIVDTMMTLFSAQEAKRSSLLLLSLSRQTKFTHRAFLSNLLFTHFCIPVIYDQEHVMSWYYIHKLFNWS